MRVQKQKKFTKKQLAVIILAVLLVTTGWISYAYFSHTWPFTKEATKPITEGGVNTVNYEPPTDQEVIEGQDAKKRSAEQEQTADQSSKSTQKTRVNVGVSYASISDNNLEVRAFTTGIIEGDGTCTVAANLNGTKIVVEKSVKAFIDSSSTLCHPIYIPVGDLRSGVWKISVTFSSNTHQGTSDTVEVNIP